MEMAEPEREAGAKKPTGNRFRKLLRSLGHSDNKDNRNSPSAIQKLSNPHATKKNDGDDVSLQDEQLASALGQSSTSIGHDLSLNRYPGVSTTLVSDSKLPSTNQGSLPETNSIDKVTEFSNKASDATNPEVSLICELWNQAYDDLRAKEETLVKDYEAIVEDYDAALSGNLDTITSSTVIFSGSKIERKDKMATILKKKIAEVDKNAWKLKFGSKEILAKDLMEPVIGIFNWANDYISNALSSNPYASLAWAGVSMLLPLLLNPSKQAASLVGGLEYISGLVVRSLIRESLYSRRYKACGSTQESHNSRPFHMDYKNTLKELYIRILKFQATSIRYYWKNGAFRIGLDMVKWNSWDLLLDDIKKQEETFCKVYDLWKDNIYEEECDALEQRHQDIMKHWDSIGSDVSGLLKAVEDAQRDSLRMDLLKWLSSIDPSENYNSAHVKHEDGTGDWLVKGNEDFDHWEQAPNSLLWLHGKAGSGKSILSYSVIKHLCDLHDSDPQTALGYFYFSFNDIAKQNTIGMLASLIKQLCCSRPDTPQPLIDMIQYKEKGHHPDLKKLEDALVATIHGFSKVYLVIDALDECPFESGERKKLLNSLRRIHVAAAPESLHLMFTSRKKSDIEAEIGPLLSSSSETAIDLSDYRYALNHDISVHIDKSLASSDYESWTADIKSEARTKLIENANGMFQYVSCQLDSLRELAALGPIRKALEDLPKGLDETYDRMLQKVNPNFQKQVTSLLKWLAFSLRPLLLDELAEAFILDHERSLPFDESERLFKSQDLLRYLSGLVTATSICVDRRGSIWDNKYAVEIRLAHFSIKEYLVSERIRQGPAAEFSITEPSAHLHISESCLAYHLQISEIELSTEESLRKYTLWEYAALHCISHLEKVARGLWTITANSRVTQILTPNAQILLNRIRIQDPDKFWGPNLTKESNELASPLYYVAIFGSLQLTDLLIENGANVNAQGGNYGNALQAAAFRGYESIVQLLLDRGADINAQGGYYGNALQAAASSGDKSIVQLLLDRGDINAQGGYFGNALQAAASRRYESIVQLLLDRGADINAKGGYFGNALQAAASRGYESIVELLLDRGTDINAQGGQYGNALQAAASRGYESIVQPLLDRGADINAQGGYFGNALQAAAARGYVQLLLDRSADINAQGGYFGNALLAAVARDHLGIALLLFSRGAQEDSPELQWERLLPRIEEIYGRNSADRLVKFREDPAEFLSSARREDPTSLLVSVRRGDSTVG